MRNRPVMGVTLVLVLGLMAVLAGCQSQPVPAAEKSIASPVVAMGGISKLAGTDSVVAYSVDFRIQNPNDFPVTVKKGDFVVSVDGDNIVAGQSPAALYIPAKSTAVQTLAGAKLWSTVRSGYSGGGADANTVTAKALPLWKKYGGANPAGDPMKAAWDALPTAAEFVGTGYIVVSAEGAKDKTVDVATKVTRP